ncbi:MAG: FAD-binding domain-containing protein [Maricaulaceae bacterium]
MERLDLDGLDREGLHERLSGAFPEAAAEAAGETPFYGAREHGLAALRATDPGAYGQTRNHLDGAVSRLSPYLRHGLVSLEEARDYALDWRDTQGADDSEVESFVKELAWRGYWRAVYARIGEAVWTDREPYKTGFGPEDYAEDLPADIPNGDTGVDFVDQCAEDLRRTGYLHNHARLWLAAYVVHFRRIKWQAGARWFLTYLLDGDVASNNLSWQWVASTFGSKPYFFNADNLKRWSSNRFSGWNTRTEDNIFDADYATLAARLFPNLDPPDPDPTPRKRAKGRR